ncbi:circumsporozoite protein-like [Camellia sinensis]|uniref:circumsporozoite protein-like n=1 Tax=Camellia sinensis TaxID=4442 RepID=UPI0010359F48|nr:circumsporozoite protein-like [Camellia sinensis]
MSDDRYVRDPDSPPPPIEYMDEMLGMMAALEGMVLRREAQLSIMGVQMPPVYQPQTGPSRPSRGAGPSRLSWGAGPSRPSRGAGPSQPSRGTGRGESSRRCKAHIVEEEPGEDEEEEEAADRQSETSTDREEGSDPGSGSGEEAEEDPEDDSSDSDGVGGAEPIPQKRTKRASYSCS